MKAWQLISTALLGILLLSGSPAIAQGNSQAMATARDTTSITMTTGMTTTRTVTITTRKISAVGTLKAKAIFLQASPRKIACLPDSKSN